MPGIFNLLQMGADHGLRLPELGRGETHVDGQVYVGCQPELGLAIGVGDVDMDSRLFSREKEESELPVTNDGGCHVSNVADELKGPCADV
jgi:hypothetical protein